MPHEISINSYVLLGEKTALIDLAEDIRDTPVEFEQELNSILLQTEDVDYLFTSSVFTPE